MFLGSLSSLGIGIFILKTQIVFFLKQIFYEFNTAFVFKTLWETDGSLLIPRLCLLLMYFLLYVWKYDLWDWVLPLLTQVEMSITSVELLRTYLSFLMVSYTLYPKWRCDFFFWLYCVFGVCHQGESSKIHSYFVVVQSSRLLECNAR